MINNKRLTALFWLVTSFILVVSLLWPGDLFWGDRDQATHISQAIMANAANRLSSYQDPGSVGVSHHPFPIWIYQLFLYATSNILMIIFFKQCATAVICLTGLYYLSKRLNYPVFPVWLYFFSPYCYMWSLMLIKDVFMMPVSLLLLVSYACFYQKRTYLAFSAALMCMIILIYMHPRGLIPSAGFVVAFILLEYKWLRKHYLWAGCLTLGALLALSPYLIDILPQLKISNAYQFKNAVYQAYHMPDVNISPAERLFSLLAGGTWFSYDFLQLFRNLEIIRSGALTVMINILSTITMAGYLLILWGMIVTCFKIWKSIKERKTFSLEIRLGIIALISIFFHLCAINVLKLLNYSYFYAGLWFCSFFFIWQAISEFREKKIIKYMFPLYLAAMMVLWLNFKLLNHIYSGYTVKNASRIAQTISEYSPASDIIISAKVNNELSLNVFKPINTIADHAILGFYYKKLLMEASAFIASRRNNTNDIYESLRPLVYLARQKKNNEGLRTKPLLIKRTPGFFSPLFPFPRLEIVAYTS